MLENALNLSFSKLCDLQSIALREINSIKLDLFRQSASKFDLEMISIAETLYGAKAGAEIFEALYAPGARSATIDPQGENFIRRVGELLAPDIAEVVRDNFRSGKSLVAIESLERLAATGTKKAIEIAVSTSLGLMPGVAMFDLPPIGDNNVVAKEEGKPMSMYGGVELLPEVKLPKDIVAIAPGKDGRRLLAMNGMCFALRPNVVVFACLPTGELTV